MFVCLILEHVPSLVPTFDLLSSYGARVYVLVCVSSDRTPVSSNAARVGCVGISYSQMKEFENPSSRCYKLLVVF